MVTKNNKKGKKKKKSVAARDDSSAGGISGGGLAALSLSSSPTKLNDVSPLLFGHSTTNKLPFTLPYIGPISIAHEGSDAAVLHGRGLITTRDVSTGECLFVSMSILSANVNEIRKSYHLQEECGLVDNAGTKLQQLAEDNLVEKIESLCKVLDDEEIQPKENVEHARRLLKALISQMSDEVMPKMESAADDLMGTLLATNSKQQPDINDRAKNLDRETILSIIRLNSFGPDRSYDKIAKCWTANANGENCCNRLLSVYPLSAMINHSCTPNAVRVFGCVKPDKSTKMDSIQENEVMIVHACANIPKGTEITWSYVPPTTPYAPRREHLQSNYRFECKCERCIMEEQVMKMTEHKELWAIADDYWSMNHNNNGGETTTMATLVPSIENIFSSTKQPSNEAQRFLRVGYSTLYMRYFNATLSQENDDCIKQTLQMATQLHFSFVSCNNASTEHLSILHFCYDLATMLRVNAMKENNSDAMARSMTQIRFWTDQLKRAHMVRFGELGEELENVREVMKHTKLVLRNEEGWYLAKHKFL